MIAGIYKLTNKVNGKIYIGQSNDIHQRWSKHAYDARQENPSNLISRAIKKYGWENFEKEILFQIESEKERDCKEIELISLYNSTDLSVGYNLAAGGNVNREIVALRGEAHQFSVFTDAEVIEIKTRKLANEPKWKVFEDFNHHKKVFDNIWCGARYSHLVPEANNYQSTTKGEKNQYGEHNANAKLSNNDVLSIRKRRNDGEERIAVYQSYKEKCSYGNFRKIWGDETWKEVQPI